jgi:hypothetical protein
MRLDRQCAALCESIIEICEQQNAATPVMTLIGVATAMAAHLSVEQRLQVVAALRSEAALLDLLGEPRSRH